MLCLILEPSTDLSTLIELIQPVSPFPIKSNNKVLLTDVDKAQCLNNYFGSVFTVEKDGSIPISTSLCPDMPDIQVTTPGVLKLLFKLDVRKSMGPDGISPRILKETSHEVAPILTFIWIGCVFGRFRYRYNTRSTPTWRKITSKPNII